VLFFLDHGGQMGALMRSKNWSQTALGPPEHWPQALRSAVAVMLRARQPMFIGWGSQYISLYNDGYIPICGKKHPDGLGQPMSELWGEIWESLEPINALVMRSEAQWFEDMPFELAGRTHGGLSYFSFSYTPLLDDDGQIAGIFCIATETTEKLRLEQALGVASHGCRRLVFERKPWHVATRSGAAPAHFRRVRADPSCESAVRAT
jgi:PAS domain-containing protein